MHSSQILLAPVVTEKTSLRQEGGVYTFRVHPDANKIQVAEAVKDAYGVNVAQVRILTLPGKVRLVGRGRTRQKRAASKRALVRLESGKTLDFNKVKTS